MIDLAPTKTKLFIMKKVTLFLAWCVIASSGLVNAQSSTETTKSSFDANHLKQGLQLPTAYYNTTTAPIRETVNGLENSQISIDLQRAQSKSFGTHGPAARPGGTDEFGESLIYTSGPYINSNSNLSILEDISEGMGTFGFGAQKASNNSIAEEFVLPMDFDINEIDVYAYQTGSTPPSITAVYMQIWDGDPSGSGSVIWGDLSTNILDDVEDAEIYRVLESDQSNTTRKIQKVTANTSGLSLAMGSYWIEYTFEGSGNSGPWAPPVAVLGETFTGSALQNLDGTWQALVDGPNNDPQGLPLQMYGVAANGGDSCSEINPAYDWLFELGLTITSGSSYSSANDLTLEAGESFTLENITALMFSDWPITEVSVTYYNDDNGIPGTVIGSETTVSVDGSNAIGSAHTSNHNVYEVTMSVDPFEFTGQENNETTYWIQLTAVNSQNTDVYWGGTYGNMLGNPMAQNEGTDWNAYESDLDGLYTWIGDCSPVLGVESNNLADFEVYPNPTKDILNFRTTKNIEAISLYNLLGQEVLIDKFDNNSTEINLGQLPIGTYILKTTIAGQVNTRKIIKE